MTAFANAGNGSVLAAPFHQPAPDQPVCIGLVGGGRWARTIASVLSGMLPERSRIVWVSPGNHAGVRRWADKAALQPGIALSIHATMQELLSDDAVRHVCIANAAADHVSTALAALNAGKNMLVEKPLALTLGDAQEIVAAAARQGRIACVGHVFLFARYLHNFRERLTTLGALRSVRVTWHDAIAERRGDEIKTFDASISVVEDVMPHVWSILRVLFPDNARISFRGLDATRAGATVAVTLEVAGVTCAAELARESDSRCRILRVEGERGAAELDFGVEPGIVRIDGHSEDADPQWRIMPRPLRTEIGYFLGLRTNEQPRHPFLASEAIDAVRLSDESRAVYEASQAKSCVALLRSAGAKDRVAARYGLIEIVLRHCLVDRRLSGDDAIRLIDDLVAWLSEDLRQSTAAPSRADLLDRLRVRLRESGRLAPS